MRTLIWTEALATKATTSRLHGWRRSSGCSELCIGLCADLSISSNGLQATTELAQHGMVSTSLLDHVSKRMTNMLAGYRYGPERVARLSFSLEEAHYHS